MKTIGDRMKQYEGVFNHQLTPKSCLFIRIDGKAFHTFTKSFPRPFSAELINAMIEATEFTASEMQGFKLAYVQSDESTFMLTDFDTLQTEGWFDYSLNKVVSISASMFTAHFNQVLGQEKLAYFDSRAFIVPKEDAPNVFIWRQRDWERNSIQMLAQSAFSQKQLHKKNTTAMQNMLLTKNMDWNRLSDQLKYGTFVLKDLRKEYSKFNYDQLKEMLFQERI